LTATTGFAGVTAIDSRVGVVVVVVVLGESLPPPHAASTASKGRSTAPRSRINNEVMEESGGFDR
jgi:hypothetical protein